MRLVSLCKSVVTLLALLFSQMGHAQEQLAAKLGNNGAIIVDQGGSVVLTVEMTAPVPWSVKFVDGPPRLVVDFRGLDLSEQPENKSETIVDAQAIRVSEKFSRLVATLREPLAITTAELIKNDDGTANLEVRLMPSTAKVFRETAAEENFEISTTNPVDALGLPLIVIDPGHGGNDPGAEAGDLRESELMLLFAEGIREALLATGQFDVALTRESDVYVSLDERMRRAQSANAEALISLHADALEKDSGSAAGLTVYTLGEKFSDAATQKMAERHALSEVLSGADLSGTGDDVALILLDVARRDSGPRSKAISQAIVRSFEESGLNVNSRPERSGDFAVLRSAGTPSVLVELGFISSAKERENLVSAEWQEKAIEAIKNALVNWVTADRIQQDAARN